jgi:hypothetical protein
MYLFQQMGWIVLKFLVDVNVDFNYLKIRVECSGMKNVRKMSS